MTTEITQLLIDALRSLLAGGPDGLEQARVKVEQAQQRVSTQPDDGLNTPENLAAQIAWLEGVAAKKRESTQPIRDEQIESWGELAEIAAAEAVHQADFDSICDAFSEVLAALVAVREELASYKTAGGKPVPVVPEAALVAVQAERDQLAEAVTAARRIKVHALEPYSHEDYAPRDLKAAIARFEKALAAVSSPGVPPPEGEGS
jgi:hypothetical protein